MQPTPQDTSSLRDSIHAAYRVVLESSATSPLHYLQHCIIDAKPEPRPYRDLAETWQWGLAQRLSPYFSSLSGLAPKPSPPNLWLTLPKGHDKSSLIGRLMSWSLAFSRVPFNAYVCAADKEQAGYLAEAMNVETSLNPWLRTRLSFNNWLIRGQSSSQLKILAADAAGSQGIRPDIIIFDEIVHCSKPDLFHHILSGSEKRSAIVIVITNAGIKFSWQWDALQSAQSSPFWYTYQAPGPLASWMSPARIADISRMLPASEARRLFQNEWVDPGEVNGYLTLPEIQRGLNPSLTYALSPTPGTQYVASIDYGSVKDRTALSLLHMDNLTGHITIDRLDVIQGTRSNPVQISLVEDWLHDIRKKFPLSSIIVDPHQMESTIQRFSGLLPIERWTPRGGKANYEMATSFRSALLNNLLSWYPSCGELLTTDPITKQPILETLEDELLMLQLKPMAYGFRVDHLPSRHDDRFCSLAMAVCHLHQSRLKRSLPSSLDQWF